MLYLQKSTEKTGTKRVPGISETAHVRLEYGGEREGYIAYIYIIIRHQNDYRVGWCR